MRGVPRLVRHLHHRPGCSVLHELRVRCRTPNPNPNPNPNPDPNPNQVDSRALRVELARADKEAASGTKPY